MDDIYRGVLGWSLGHKLWSARWPWARLRGHDPGRGHHGLGLRDARGPQPVRVDLELPAGTSLDELSRRSFAAEQELKENPLIKTVYATLGPNQETNKASWRIVTVGKTERKETIAEIKDLARSVAGAVEGSKVVITDPPFVEGAGTQAPIMILVRGSSYDEIVPVANAVGAHPGDHPGVVRHAGEIQPRTARAARRSGPPARRRAGPVGGAGGHGHAPRDGG
jgi:HAE1 family hydrophobic/amphiphilic exporter-1